MAVSDVGEVATIDHKLCGKCLRTLPTEDFHKRKASKDGLCARCISCQQDYDKARLHKPDRVAAREAYRRTDKGRERVDVGRKKWVKSNPEKRAAHIALGHAVKAGRVIKQPCMVCGSTFDVEAHHSDYSKPLDVEWFCTKHHGAHHRSLKAA